MCVDFDRPRRTYLTGKPHRTAIPCGSVLLSSGSGEVVPPVGDVAGGVMGAGDAPSDEEPVGVVIGVARALREGMRIAISWFTA
jgi:hypothetical protein